MVAIKDMLGDQTVVRADGRKVDELRPVRITRHFTDVPEGSVLIECGNTRVMCTATFTAGVPRWRKDSGLGWVTAEYAMLPRATADRTDRESVRGKIGGRTHEISRLIGRCLRGVVDMKALGENQVQIDCDVLQADGGTRTAAITGAMVALVCAVSKLLDEGKLLRSPITHQIAAISVGVVDDTPCVDLCYEEDSRAQVDMNIVMNEKGEFVELQGTGEGRSFTQAELNALLDMGAKGIRALMEKQKDSLAESKRHLSAKPTLVVASSNQHKIRELQHIFGDYYTVVSMVAAGFNAPIEETATTFAGNAAIKAETVSAATGLPTLADDSGLSVEVLDGDPGVYSARYAMMAGEGSGDAANNALLLRRMKGKTDRSCAFICALALKIPGRETLIAEGSCPGVLLEEERGTGGFGYDPLFLYEPLNKTFAEVTEEEKNQISHRARACEKMLEIMKGLHE